MYYQKLLVLITNILFFSLIYSFFDDTHFSGINTLQETIREEIIKQNITSYIKEDMEVDVKVLEEKEKKILKEETKEIKSEVAKNEFAENELDKLKPNIFERFYNRLYFSTITGTTLGYGDIYPTSNTCRFFVMIQLLITICIVFN